MEYQHGGDIYSHKVELDVSANINPLGMPEGVREAAVRSLEESVRYPDSQSRRLRAALSRIHGVREEQIVCGNGAADLIFGLALALKPKRALLLAPGFSEYEQALKTVDCQIDFLYLREEQGFVPSLGELETGLSPKTGLVFVCNPNNPTGVAWKRQELETLALECLERGTVLAVDECFCDFLERPEEASLIPVLGKYPNVVILKAFTKLYAMAGLRLGYCLCGGEETAKRLAAVRQPWSVSNVAQAAGLAALADREFPARTRRFVAGERAFLMEGLRKAGMKVYASEANYVFFRDPAEEGGGKKGRLYEALLEKKILIRSCANYRGLDCSFYRVCVGVRRDNERLLAALAQAAGEGFHGS